MREKFLPIGTVILLKEATKRLMITGYCSAKPDEPEKVYDYVGMLFPEGNLAGDDVALFNHDQIGTIAHMGLEDEEFKTLEKNMKDALANSDAAQPVLTPLDTTPVTEASELPPFTPENINNILEQIRQQGDALKPISEPTAFDETVIRKPTFEMPTLDGSGHKKDDEKEEQDEKDETDNLPNEENVNEEKVADGQPVLQLQPIFNDEAPAGGSGVPVESSTGTDSGIAGLSRL